MNTSLRSAPIAVALVAVALVAIALVAMACSSSNSASDESIPSAQQPAQVEPSAEDSAAASPQPSEAASQAATEADGADVTLACGASECGADEYCDERFKGHARDRNGRALQRKKCLPLPEPCRAAPTCECVTQHVSATGCTEKDGRVHTSDYPR